MRGVFDQATRYRSFVIARTETTAAANMAQIAVMERAGIRYKQWVTGGDERTCPLCGALNGKVVRIDEEFAPGVLAPPRHPQCRCALVSRPLDYFRIPEEDIPEWSSERGSAWLKRLDAKEQAAVVSYTGTDYMEINGYLRGQIKPNPQRKTELDKKITILSRALQHSRIPHNLEVFRGTWSLPHGVTDAFSLKGKEWREDGFMSLSLSERVAKGFGGKYLLEVRIPKGTRGCGYVAEISQYRKEHEVLLDKGSVLRIIDVVPDEDGKIRLIAELVAE